MTSELCLSVMLFEEEELEKIKLRHEYIVCCFLFYFNTEKQVINFKAF